MGVSVLISSRIYLFAEGVRRLLEPMPGIRPVGVACSRDDLITMLDAGPDVIVADVSMGPAILGNLLTDTARLLLLHGSPTLPQVLGDLRDLVSRGLGGVLAGQADEQMLGKAIRTIAAGELWLDRKTVADTLCGTATP